MKKIFLFAAAVVASATLSAEVSFEACLLDSAKFVEIAGAETATKTKVDFAAGTVFLDGTNMKVSLPFASQHQWISAAQPDGQHKKVQIGSIEINMTEAFQGNDNPKDADGGNPCNTLLEPASGAFFQIDAKADGWVVVLHKASSNKQYFVFEEGSALGYKFGMMTYAETTLGENGLIQYELVGDNELNYLTAANLLASTGFDKIAWVEDYVNDTLTSGVPWESYKQNGVSAIAFQVFEDTKYYVGAAGSKITCAALVFVKDLEDTLPIVALGETVEEEGKDPVAYDDVVLLELEAAEEQGVENVNAAVKAVKAFENGQLVIIKNGVRYNVLGATL